LVGALPGVSAYAAGGRWRPRWPLGGAAPLARALFTTLLKDRTNGLFEERICQIHVSLVAFNRHLHSLIGGLSPAKDPAHDLIQEIPNMSIAAHLAELERRHRALEAEIVEARAHPSIDHLQIVELKRRKLLVRDEIARLQN
jgi:hypothetical protein